MSVGMATAATPRRKSSVWPIVRGWLFIGPVVLGTLIFNVLPLVPTVYISFTDWNGLGAPVWAGLANYRRALTGADDVFSRSLANTVLFTIGYVPVAMIVSLGLALLVNEKLRGITLFRGIFFLPVVTSVVAVGMVWRWIFNWQFGVLNWALEQVGIQGPRWLGDPSWAMISVIIVAIWHSMGYNMVILLAGLQGVPQELLDAASIDGAGTWRRFLNVTLPLITPTLFFLLIISVIGSFRVFGLIYAMTGGGPGSATYVYVYHLWHESFVLRRFGYGASMAWMLFLVIGAITWFQWWMGKRWVHYQ